MENRDAAAGNQNKSMYRAHASHRMDPVMAGRGGTDDRLSTIVFAGVLGTGDDLSRSRALSPT